MGSNSSRSEEHAEVVKARERNRRAREELRLLEEQQAVWRRAQLLEQHHREQRLQEEEKLKRNREEWLRQANLREQQQQQQMLREQQLRTQQLLNQNQHWEQLRVQQEQLVKKDPSPAQSNVAPLTFVPKPPGSAPPINSRVTSQRKSNSPQMLTTKPPVSPQPTVPSLISLPKMPVTSQPKIPPLISIPKAPASSKSHKTRVITAKKPSSNSDETPELYYRRYASPKFPFTKWTDIDYIQEIHGISQYVAENIIALFKTNNTISFIARYRKNTTLGMDVDQLKNIKNTSEQAKLLKQKVDALIKEIDKQGSCNAELYALLCSTRSLNDFAWIESIFKFPKPAVEKARRIGLNIPAEAIIKGQHSAPLLHYVNSNSESLKTEQQVKSVITCLVADIICKEPRTFEAVKMLRKKYSLSIETKKCEDSENAKTRSKANKNKADYQSYYNFSSFEKNIKPHQVLEIDRGEGQKIINVKVIVPDQFEKDFKEFYEKQYGDVCRTSDLHKSIMTAAFDFAWNATIKTNIFKLTRQELTRKAEISLIADIVKNAKSLLLIPPLKGQVIIGIQPGFQNGCKLAVVSEQGEVLQTETIHPHDGSNPKAKQKAEHIISEIILMHKCSTLALGDGAACRDTEIFLTEIINKPAFQRLNITYAIVDVIPAIVYASSQEASMEFPYLDANFKAAICLARRLQDPMAELIKIEPRQWNLKISQHNLPAKQLVPQLNEVIEEAVSFVGVDINTASLSLLKRVAGMNETKAKNLIKWRESSGPFRTRNDLKKVEGICNKTFEQCAGFMKILPETAVCKDRRMGLDPLNYLDQTCIHPEMYDIAEAFLRATNCDPLQLGTKSFSFSVMLFVNNQGYSALASKYHTTVETMKIIIEGFLMEKGYDVRGKTDTSMFRKSLKNLEDLVVGTVLTGVVRSNVHFGSFVDVGVEIEGLIHKTKTGGVTLDIGQKVETKVLNVNIERRRFGLALVRCV